MTARYFSVSKWAGPFSEVAADEFETFRSLVAGVADEHRLDASIRRFNMLDLVFAAITVAFFSVALVYTLGCDRGIAAG
jgi:hypothetical protein